MSRCKIRTRLSSSSPETVSLQAWLKKEIPVHSWIEFEVGGVFVYVVDDSNDPSNMHAQLVLLRWG